MEYELKNGTGKVKEYDSFGELQFEGEYLNGKRNGKGKEYLGGTLIFEGIYLNDKKWEGKGYDNNLFLFRFFFHLNILLQILIYHPNDIL